MTPATAMHKAQEDLLQTDERERFPRVSPATLIAILTATATLYWASIVFIPIAFSFLLFYLLDPASDAAKNRWHIPRSVSAPILLLLVGAFVALLAWGGVVAFDKIVDQIPTYWSEYSDKIQEYLGKFGVTETPKAESWMPYLLRGLGSVTGALTAGILIPFLTLFLLIDKPHFQKTIAACEKSPGASTRLSRELSRTIVGFSVASVLIGLGTSAGFYLLFMIVGLKNCLSLALTSGFMNLIPIFGPVFGLIMPVAQSVMQFGNWNLALAIAVFSILLHTVVVNFIIPKLVGSKININSTVATIGLVFWGWIWGAAGLFLAIPLTAAIRIFLDASPMTRSWAALLSQAKPAGKATHVPHGQHAREHARRDSAGHPFRRRAAANRSSL